MDRMDTDRIPNRIFIRINRLKWIGHVNRMDASRIQKKSIFINQPEGKRLRARPRNRWLNCVQADLRKCKIID